MGTLRGIVSHELLVNFQNAFQLAIENLGVDVGQVEVDHRLPIDAEIVLVDNLENRARSHIARHQIPIFRVPLFQEVPALALRNGQRIAFVARRLRNPHPSAFAARRLRHQPQFVFARNASWMDLDEFAVGVEAPLLVQRRLCRPRTHHRVGGLAEDRAITARSDNDRVGRKSAHFHGAQIHGADAAADFVRIKHRREKFPALVFLDLAFRLVAAHLLIERIEKLLSRSGSGECRAVVERPAKAAKIQQALPQCD